MNEPIILDEGGMKWKSDKPKFNKVWYHFYMDYGPGHQSHEETYKLLEPNLSRERIRDECEFWTNHFMNDNVMYGFRKKTPPKKWLEEEIEDVQRSLERKMTYLSELKFELDRPDPKVVAKKRKVMTKMKKRGCFGNIGDSPESLEERFGITDRECDKCSIHDECVCNY